MASAIIQQEPQRSRTPRGRDVLWDVIDEHLAEADFLAGQWLAVARSSRISARARQITIEPRLIAHVDGLVLGGATVADRALWPLLAVGEPDDAAPLLAAVLALLADADGATVDRLVERLRDTRDAGVRAAIGKAFAITARADVSEPVRLALYATDAPPAQAALLAILAGRRVAPGPISGALLASPSESVRAAALSAVAAIGGLDREPHLTNVEDGLVHASPVVRGAARRTGLVWNLRSAWQSCTHQARAGDLDALVDWASLGGASAVSALAAQLTSPPASPLSWRSALFALGFSGSPEAVDACVPMLSDSDPAVARLAAEAVGAITGLDVSEAPFASPPPEDDTGEPLREVDPAELDLAPTDELPSPAPDAIRTWWRERRGAFATQVRYLRGQPWSLEAVQRALGEGPLRRTGPLAREIAIRTGGRGALDAFRLGQARPTLPAEIEAALHREPAWR